MRRTTGILLGAMLMLGIFLLVLSAGTAPPPVKALASSQVETSPVDSRPEEEAPGVNSPGHALLTATDSAGVDEKSLPDGTGDRLKLDLDPKSWNQAMGAHESVLHKEPTQASRYLVWSPFHSKWAAQGFARRLTLATEVPVEVVNEGPGNYQVVFSYRDDVERQAMVRQIEAVTGLELE